MKKILIIILLSTTLNTIVFSNPINCVFGSISVTPPAGDCCISPKDILTFTTTFSVGSNCTITKWIIDMGDGTINTINNSVMPSFTYGYNLPGSYVVSLMAYNINAPLMFQPITKRIDVHTDYECLQCGVADFTFSNYDCLITGSAFESKSFVNVCDVDQIIYAWNFGDPNSGDRDTSNLVYPQHFYTTPGLHLVTHSILIIRDQDTCIATKTEWVDVSFGIPIFHPVPQVSYSPNPVYLNSPVSFSSNAIFSLLATIDFGDGNMSNWAMQQPINHTYATTGSVMVTIHLGGECPFDIVIPITVNTFTTELPCSDCIGSFNPEQGKKYIVSSWVKEENADPLKLTYTFPSIVLSFTNGNGAVTNSQDLYAKGEIIDGWQRIEEIFNIPANTAFIDIKMKCTSANCLFDDLRVFPYDGTMKSFVYDSKSLRLMAELDERNYATLYEYDEEGKIIRVKKETERGVMTIQENRNNTSKK